MTYIYIHKNSAKSILLILLISLLCTGGFAQRHPLGALVLSKADYAALPRPNWDTLKKYSNRKANSKVGPLNATGITMLMNPPIGDQGGEGSCVGWAVGYTATGILNFPKYGCWNIAERSPNYVYNQIKVSNDCASGSFPTDALNLVTTQGDCSWALMPYVDGDCITQPNAAQINDASQNKALRWTTLDLNDVEGIKQALDLGFPVVITQEVYQSFFDMWNTGGGIWNSPNTGTDYGSHATCIVGYDDTKQMFKVQNQWGNGGDNGFYWVTYNLVQNNYLNGVFILYGSTPFVPSIVGSTLICNSSVYSINNLPLGLTVTWSIPSSAGSVLQLSPNTPVANQLTITNQHWYSISTTLTAIVTGCGITPDTLTKTIANDNDNSPFTTYSYNQESCIYYNVYHPSQNGTITSNASPVFVHQGCTVTVNLYLGTGHTVTFIPTSSDPVSNPIYWTYSGTNLYFQLPLGSGGIPFRFRIAGDGACYQKDLLFFTYSNNGNGGYSMIANPNPANDLLNVTIQENADDVPATNSTYNAIINSTDSSNHLAVPNSGLSSESQTMNLVGGGTKLSSISTETAKNLNSSSLWQVSLIDINGKLIKTISSVRIGQGSTIKVHGLPAGMYILKATNGKEYLKKKIIISK